MAWFEGDSGPPAAVAAALEPEVLGRPLVELAAQRYGAGLNFGGKNEGDVDGAGLGGWLDRRTGLIGGAFPGSTLRLCCLRRGRCTGLTGSLLLVFVFPLVGGGDLVVRLLLRLLAGLAGLFLPGGQILAGLCPAWLCFGSDQSLAALRDVVVGQEPSGDLIQRTEETLEAQAEERFPRRRAPWRGMRRGLMTCSALWRSGGGSGTTSPGCWRRGTGIRR